MPQIIEQLTALIGCSEEMARTFLEEFASQVTVGLRDRGVVTVKEIGTFRRGEVADGSTTCEFAPSRELAEAVNAPFSMFEAVELDEDVTEAMLDRAARVAPDEPLEATEADEVVAEAPAEETAPVEVPAERQEEAPIEPASAEAPQTQAADESAMAAEVSVEVPEVEVVTVEVASEVSAPASTPVPTPTPDSTPAPASPSSPVSTPVIAPVAAPASVPPPIPSKEDGKHQLPPIPINRGERSSMQMPQPQRRSGEAHGDERRHEGKHRHERRRGSVPPPMPRMKRPRRVTLSSLVATALLALIAGAAIGYFAYSQLNLEGVKSVNISAEDVQVIHAQPADSVAVDTVKAVLAPTKEAADTVQRADVAKSATQPTVANVATAAAPVAVVGVVTDTVRAGYFLTTMAQRHYGKKKFWVYIYLENREKLGNPDHIKPSTVVVVPPAEKYGIKPGDKASEADAERKSAEIIATYSK